MAPAHRQHGIGIVFFHRKNLRTLRNKAQRIKISDDAVGYNIQLFQMAQTAVCRQNIVLISNGCSKFIKLRRAEDHTCFHNQSPKIGEIPTVSASIAHSLKKKQTQRDKIVVYR